MYGTIPCKYCGTPTKMFGTKLCDNCWEMESRMKRNVKLAKKILSTIIKEKEEQNKRLER